MLQQERLDRLKKTPTQLVDEINNFKTFGISLVQALDLDKPSEFFYLVKDNGMMKKYFPDLYLCIGLMQNSHHTDDVFTHTMKALDSCRDLDILDLEVRMAILFHDLGKNATLKERK